MPSRIVIFAPNWLGDAVMAWPAMLAVRRFAAGAELAAVARPSVAPLVAVLPGLHRVLAFDRDAGARPLAGERFDLAVLFPNSFASAWRARQARIPERWGYRSDGRRWLLTRSVAPPRGRRHQSAYYAALVEALGMPVEPGAPEPIVPPAGARESAADLLGRHGWRGTTPLVAIAPGAAYGHAKRWPPARFAALAAEIVRRRQATLAVVGAATDRDAALAIDAELGNAGVARASNDAAGAGWIDLVGQTTLPQLMGIASISSAFVSNDSGAMHLAAATGARVVAVFGATDERATGPMVFGARAAEAGGHEVLTARAFCRPCLLRECPIDHRCMTRISVYDVAAAVDRVLSMAGRTASGAASGAAGGDAGGGRAVSGDAASGDASSGGAAAGDGASGRAVPGPAAAGAPVDGRVAAGTTPGSKR